MSYIGVERERKRVERQRKKERWLLIPYTLYILIIAIILVSLRFCNQ